tara:strand:+ start:5085 stop:5360 length:276 start_codon:yes stop_codon:yes gene_type:complete
MLTQIVSQIYNIDSMDDLTAITSAIRCRRDELSSRIKYKFRVGQRVWFLSKTKNEKVYGVIHQIDKKNIQVKVDDYNIWRVSPSLLNDGEL